MPSTDQELIEQVRQRLTTVLMALLWLLLGIVLAYRFIPHTPKPALSKEDYRCVIKQEPADRCLLLRHVEYHLRHPRYRG